MPEGAEYAAQQTKLGSNLGYSERSVENEVRP